MILVFFFFFFFFGLAIYLNRVLDRKEERKNRNRGRQS